MDDIFGKSIAAQMNTYNAALNRYLANSLDTIKAGVMKDQYMYAAHSVFNNHISDEDKILLLLEDII